MQCDGNEKRRLVYQRPTNKSKRISMSGGARFGETYAALVYARLSEDPVRRALEDHERRVLVAAGLKPEGKVVEMGARDDSGQ